MPGLRMLIRLAPLVVGLLAVRVWLRRREARRRALAAAADVPQIGAVRAPEEPQTAAPPRVQREPIDIVTVVDDLLLPGR